MAILRICLSNEECSRVLSIFGHPQLAPVIRTLDSCYPPGKSFSSEYGLPETVALSTQW